MITATTYSTMRIEHTSVPMGNATELTGQERHTGKFIDMLPKSEVQKEISTSGLAGCTALALYLLYKNNKQRVILMHQPLIEDLHTELQSLLFKKIPSTTVARMHAVIFSPYIPEQAEFFLEKKIVSLKKKIQRFGITTHFLTHGYILRCPLFTQRSLHVMLKNNPEESHYIICDDTLPSYPRPFNHN